MSHRDILKPWYISHRDISQYNTSNCDRKNVTVKEEVKLEQLVYILYNNLPLYYSADDTQKKERSSNCDKENQKQKTQQRGANENVRIT